MSTHKTPSYFLVPNLRAMDSSACELDPDTLIWIQPTIIEDEDLMFGGKALSAWYEEERRRLSLSGSSDEDEEEPHRGRQRFRRDYRDHHHSYHHHRHDKPVSSPQLQELGKSPHGKPIDSEKPVVDSVDVEDVTATAEHKA